AYTVSGWRLLAEDGSNGAADGGEETQQPAAAIFSLYEPAYRRDDQWIPPVELTVDAAEYLFNNLVLLYLEEEVRRASPFGRQLAARAQELLASLPEEVRQPAYLQAAADFASHALAVAGQLERSARRHQNRDSNVCRHKDAPWSLFGLWDRIFTTTHYPASYHPAPSNDSDELAAPQRAVTTDISLTSEDKELLRRYLFGDVWDGSKEHDLLPRYCPGEVASDS
ncbi:MAG: hypothetical protein SX243_15720, partial [Acidobacteriota bacterium]|nr:hypothetical protein [Acidobacteriota bacterium]